MNAYDAFARPNDYLSYMDPSTQESAYGINVQDAGYQMKPLDSGYQMKGNDSGYQMKGNDSGYQMKGNDSGYQMKAQDTGYQMKGHDPGYHMKAPPAIDTSNLSKYRSYASSPSSPYIHHSGIPTVASPFSPAPNSSVSFDSYMQPHMYPRNLHSSVLDDCIYEYLRPPSPQHARLMPTPPMEHGILPAPLPLPLRKQNIQKASQDFYHCPEPGCTKYFLKQYNLNSHSRVHSSDKPHSCKSCSLSFKRKHDLVRHAKLVHKQCHLCAECFLSTRDLSAHLVDMHHMSADVKKSVASALRLDEDLVSPPSPLLANEFK